MKELTEKQITAIHDLSKTISNTIGNGYQVVLYNKKAHRKIAKNNETGLYDVTLNGELVNSYNYEEITSYVYGLLLSEVVVNGE